MKKLIIFITLFLLAISLSSCLRVNYLKQNKFMFDVHNSEQQIPKKQLGEVLFVDEVKAVDPYSELSFIYRISNNQYLPDYYNAFIVSPPEQIKNAAIEHIGHTKLFKFVTSDAGRLKHDYILELNLTKLYADYRDRNNPTGVIEIQATLIKSVSNDKKIIFTKTFTQSNALSKKDAQSLVESWNCGLDNILSQIEIS